MANLENLEYSFFHDMALISVVPVFKAELKMSRVMRKPTFWQTNQAVQPKKVARGLKFRI